MADSGTTPAALRLMSDLRDVRKDPNAGVSAGLKGDSLFFWSATIVGPSDTPWEGGIFSMTLHFPQDYPQRPPKVKFQTPIFHPNVYSDGTLCLDIIQDKYVVCSSPIFGSMRESVSVCPTLRKNFDTLN
eukprot:TRINITY_DN1995_c0_g1_i1.p1 TRINITY_DN1995_c0_g1~~TRINITY_DN1995_c0_g1_i1.p1  ORF type:complete len:130 (-),score=0.80 TRINITY_DN1995_c0_g1_i1:435-824(-)